MEKKHEEQVKILDKHANVSLSFIVFTLIYPSTITYVYIISLKSQLIVIILYVDRCKLLVQSDLHEEIGAASAVLKVIMLRTVPRSLMA